MGLGASLVIGGVAQLLTSNSSTPARESKRNESYLFDQASSVGSQGLPVPVLYGERFVSGLSIISSGISTQDVSL
jgi:predicted phage tail protein